MTYLITYEYIGASLSDLLKSNDVSNKITIDNTRYKYNK